MVLASSVFGLVSARAVAPVAHPADRRLMARGRSATTATAAQAPAARSSSAWPRRYLDEIGFVVHKDSRDTIRRIHREIRDHYTERAEQLERTLQQAMAAAEQAPRPPRGRRPPAAPVAERRADRPADAAVAADRLVAGAALAS